jgi:hypothetical protein
MITYPVIRLTIGSETLEFSNEKVISANLVEEINMISVEVPISVIEFRILSTDTSFSMFSGEYFDLLSERLPVMVYESIDGVETFLGKYYLEEWKNVSEHEFEFRAIDIIGVMEATDYDGGFWGTATKLSVILSQVLNAIDVPYVLDDSIKDTELTGWIPPGTYRGALQQICYAAKATASTSRSSSLLINPISLPDKIYDVKIGDSEKFMEQSIELQPLVTSIELIAHNYTQGDTLEEIFNKELPAGSHKIVFEKPYYDIVIDGPGYTPSLLITETDDFIITENGDFIEVGGEYLFGPNSIYLELQEAGTVTITGYPWLDSKRSYTFRETGVTEYANKNVLKISDATLVSDTNAQAVLDQTRDYYRQRYVQKIKLLPSSVKPADIVLTNTFYGKKILANAKKMSIDMTGGHLATTEIFGIEPAYVPPAAEPVRRARTGIAICGADLTRNNGWREYA